MRLALFEYYRCVCVVVLSHLVVMCPFIAGTARGVCLLVGV